MEIVAKRLAELRKSLSMSQMKLSKALDISQAALNRYEHNKAPVSDTVLLKYADFFDISVDYILGRCDDPKGKKFDYEPEFLKDKLSNSTEWREFVEMCFDPNSAAINKLKDALFQLAEEK